MTEDSGYSLIYKFAFATFLFVIGQVISWSASYAQFVWEWVRNNILVFSLMTAIPASLCFTYGVRMAYEFFGNGWAPRFYVFGISFLVYPALFSYFMNEPFFSYKNAICLVLAIAIMVVQVTINK